MVDENDLGRDHVQALLREEREEQMKEDEAEFGRRLSAAVVASGLSKAEVARRFGLSMQNFSKMCLGRVGVPKVRTLRRLGDALGVPWHTLVGD